MYCVGNVTELLMHGRLLTESQSVRIYVGSLSDCFEHVQNKHMLCDQTYTWWTGFGDSAHDLDHVDYNDVYIVRKVYERGP